MTILADKSAYLLFQNNALLPSLFGEHDQYLQRIESKLGVSASSRGNQLYISGRPSDVECAKKIFQMLYHHLEKGQEVAMGDVDAAIRMSPCNDTNRNREYSPMKKQQQAWNDTVIRTEKKHVKPYSLNQQHYIEQLMKHELVIAAGPAGTGKTYLAVAAAVSMFLEQKVERIILSRPAVEAGEKLGFLPGDLKEKVDPYLQPLYDALHDMMSAEQVMKYIETGTIEIAPLAFMRGRTLNNAFIILDEAQNATPTQMKMFLTRLGEGSRMVACGDLSQTDLPPTLKSGLRDATEKLAEIDEVAMIKFDDQDVVRHPLTAKIVKAYQNAVNKLEPKPAQYQ